MIFDLSGRSENHEQADSRDIEVFGPGPREYMRIDVHHSYGGVAIFGSATSLGPGVPEPRASSSLLNAAADSSFRPSFEYARPSKKNPCFIRGSSRNAVFSSGIEASNCPL